MAGKVGKFYIKRPSSRKSIVRDSRAKRKRPASRGRDVVPTTDAVWRYLRAPSLVYGPLLGAAEEVRGRLRFFHWPLEFPDIMQRGGFDVVLGNPPWERIKLQEQEFFAARSPEIAGAPNKAGVPTDRAGAPGVGAGPAAWVTASIDFGSPTRKCQPFGLAMSRPRP